MDARPRLEPVDPAGCAPEVQRLLERVPAGPDGRPLNVFGTLAHAGPAFAAWLPFGAQLLRSGTLPGRTRELAVLRTASLCRNDYEWGHHVPIGLAAGLTEDEVGRVPGGPSDAWTPLDRLVLQAVDELHVGAALSATTWAGLAEHLDAPQLVELCMVVGQYHLVAFVLNSAGTRLEPGLSGLPGR